MSLPVSRNHFDTLTPGASQLSRSACSSAKLFTKRKLARRRRGSTNGIMILVMLLAGGIAATFAWLQPQTNVAELVKSSDGDNQPTRSANKKRFPTFINPGPDTPTVATGVTDLHGAEVTVSCATCHANRKPNFANRTPSDLNEFHSGIALSHGSISCLSCHNENDYDSLKLADGTSVAYKDVMLLCAQCHGPQTRDYNHGAHGGMQGHWDLSRGPRTKNNCVDCHAPHVPQFPKMKPTFKPKDRFLDSADEGANHE